MNRLIHETSPYLLQHAHNPVDWYPWGDEAFRRAREENKPVFLSVGYSACHWCHVMERESFENEKIAAILNREFVSIKVDREERPDVDSIYMNAVQMMTGHGGWPMSVFLRPDGLPFFGGTYFPPTDSRGMPGFDRVLTQIADAYRTRPNEVEQAATQLREALESVMKVGGGDTAIGHPELNAAAQKIEQAYDPYHGGFGGAPKFPAAMALDFLQQVAWRTGSDELRQIVASSLEKMAHGGIYDQVGGGFHRYSVDARWLVPHFEKMLYDNALLARVYTRMWQWRRDSLYARIAKETLEWVAREMTAPEGGFYSTLDADSEGEEGKFYVWSRQEVLEVLGDEEGRIFAALYDVSDRGNWEGTNILNMPRSPEAVAADLGIAVDRLADIAARGRCMLLEKRESRVRPGRDEKVLAGWNGWMLAAFAEAALAFQSPQFLEITRRNADFLIERMTRDGRLLRSWKDGVAKIDGLLEDYGGVAVGLIAAFEATQEMRYLETARSLALQIGDRFRDDERGGFFDTPSDHERLITRPKDVFDNATPSGNSLAADAFLRLALYYGDAEMQRLGESTIRAAAQLALQHPTGFGYLLAAAEWSTGKPKEIAITAWPEEERSRDLFCTAVRGYVPHRIVVTSRASGTLPVLEGKPADRVAAYVCEGYACSEPTDDPQRLQQLLGFPPEVPLDC